tara:strand:- start:34 stop:198 length:165 start_codon:yes stop_codon:yes gene_type:complete
MKKIYLIIFVPTLIILSILVPYAYKKIKLINSQSPKIISDVASMMERGEWAKKR